ncbi:MAG: polysaccharide biosynthesis/export family protein, partial [Brumimicrobium sp.]|nr:polysaccharide biosynthesis/export family protein [Brumimicrobium sp.]
MKKFFHTRLLITGLLMLVLTSSCGTYERMVYFQEDASDTTSISGSYTPVFKPDDFIAVVVTAEDPETAVPFNFPLEFVQQGGAGGGYQGGGAAQIGYLVDEEGYIDLPVIGRIQVGGKTRNTVKEELAGKYEKYLSKP